jgi:hypothetical protein
MGTEAYGFTIDPQGLKGEQARAYEISVRRELSFIAQVASGQVLINAVRFWKIPILISPYDDSQDACNATVENHHMDSAGILHPRVLITPSLLGRGSACWKHWVNTNQTNAVLPHEVLFHELIHAFRSITKSAHKQFSIPPTNGGLYRFTNEEEFIAVVTTNIFISDPSNRYKTGLRADHYNKFALQKGLDDSFGFFRSGKDTFRLIERFCKQNPGFTAALAKIPAKFNPLAAYYTNPQKAQELSAQWSTYERDVQMMVRKGIQTIDPPRRNPTVPVIPGLDTI